MRRAWGGFFVGIGLLAWGCGSGGETPESATSEADDAASPTASALDPVIAAYDELRAQLVEDKTEGLAAGFERLRAAAATAEGGATSDELRGHLEKLSAAAERGAKGEGADLLKEARARFAEASEQLVAAISSEPELKSRLHLFECPMAEGYPKWVQTSGELANPYMGTLMPTCGADSAWSE